MEVDEEEDESTEKVESKNQNEQTRHPTGADGTTSTPHSRADPIPISTLLLDTAQEGDPSVTANAATGAEEEAADDEAAVATPTASPATTPTTDASARKPKGYASISGVRLMCTLRSHTLDS